MLLAFEHSQHCQNCRVGDRPVLTQFLINIPDRGFAAGPDDLHDLQFLLG
jgi:hypothetical protein